MARSSIASPAFASSAPLSTRQVMITILLGAILWYAAAALLRYLGPMGVYEGNARLIMYALVIPGTLPFTLLIRRVAGLGRDQLALGVSVATTAAMLLDGIALAWFPGLYGGTSALVAGAGAAILWGAAVGLVLAFVVDHVTRR